jgi:transcriptional regulator GlxA family with amidase domain
VEPVVYEKSGRKDFFRFEESLFLYQLFGALFRERANLNEVAQDEAVSPEHLTRRFSECYGQTLSRMLREFRIGEARLVIESGVENLEAVTRAVEFSDVWTLRRYL